MIQLDLDAGEAVEAPILSPDGSSVVFVSRGTNGSHLRICRLDQTSISTLAGTEGARYPFFSPGGRSVAFFTADSSSPAQRRLKTVSLDGAAINVLADADNPGGGSWGESGLIAAIPQMWRNGFVYRIPAAGGSPEAWIPAVPRRRHSGASAAASREGADLHQPDLVAEGAILRGKPAAGTQNSGYLLTFLLLAPIKTQPYSTTVTRINVAGIRNPPPLP